MLDAFVQLLGRFRDKTIQCGTIDTYCGATYVNKSIKLDTNGSPDFLLIKKIKALCSIYIFSANTWRDYPQQMDALLGLAVAVG